LFGIQTHVIKDIYVVVESNDTVFLVVKKGFQVPNGWRGPSNER
jgi:hypothetical protein